MHTLLIYQINQQNTPINTFKLIFIKQNRNRPVKSRRNGISLP